MFLYWDHFTSRWFFDLKNFLPSINNISLYNIDKTVNGINENMMLSNFKNELIEDAASELMVKYHPTATFMVEIELKNKSQYLILLNFKGDCGSFQFFED